MNPTLYIDGNGNELGGFGPHSDYLNEYEYIDEATKARLDSAGNTSMLATVGTMVVNLAISLIFGGSIQAMWVMVNTI